MPGKFQEVNKMSEDTFSTMVKDGNDFIQIIKSVPEDKRFLLSMMLDAFVNGMAAQERLSAEAERPGV